MNYCRVCQEPIHPKRVELGYKNTCVNHSDASKYAGFVSGAGKVDYEISIVRDPETAKYMQKLLQTRGQS
tara:strand:+ start:164 stop:373 length:210 start_codon:yes stop_codon:yes gene_type:complete